MSGGTGWQGRQEGVLRDAHLTLGVLLASLDTQAGQQRRETIDTLATTARALLLAAVALDYAVKKAG